MESIAKSQAFGGAFPLQKKNIFFSFYLTKAKLLALTKKDIDLVNNQIHITKTYFRSEGRDIITTPKTDCSVRVIDIPEFLKEEIENYIGRLYPNEQKKLAEMLNGQKTKKDKSDQE